MIPEFPAEPSAAEVLEGNGLSNAQEQSLTAYVEKNWDSADGWIPFIKEHEEKKLAQEYVERIGTAKGEAVGFWRMASDRLRKDRLVDRRRVVDAVLRKLGRIGTEKSMPALFELSQRNDRQWVNWKAFASIQEILTRVEPGKLDEEALMQIPAELVGPLLRDLDPRVANDWAWTLWEHHEKWLMTSFRSTVRLRTRIWLASAFAASHPQQAWEVFLEGLQSQDPAIRLATEMIVRTGVGGSLPYELSTEQLAKAFAGHKWSSATPLWHTLPLPLDRPLLREFGERADLIWLSRAALISKTKEDVWPLIREFLPNGLFYSRVGDFFPAEFALSDAEGRPYSRIPSANLSPSVASHGGLWTLARGVAELHPDGSVLWECPIHGDYRQITPLGQGRILLLGTGFMESRDRRGDLLWKTGLESLDDPRDIVAVEGDRFLLSCVKSIGWITREGNYQPVLSGLKSALWVRYHPIDPWVIFDAGDQMAVIFDPVTKTELGRFDLDDGEGRADSRFPFPPTYFPE
ncbi:MAG: hypothetical protein V4675_16040 [Verrucomicrobiota bacterium]